MSAPTVRPLAVGDLIRDNDPQMHGRGAYRVGQIKEGKAISSDDPFSIVTIAVSRIHLDGKLRRSGWSRVTA